MGLEKGAVLIVDNHEGMPELIAKMLLCLFGFFSDCAGSFEEAIFAITRKEYILVISNNRLLGGESGGELVIQSAKAVSGASKTILMSSFESDAEIAKKAKADAFFLKPIRLKELEKTVEVLLAG